jgi:hypothetical protein
MLPAIIQLIATSPTKKTDMLLKNIPGKKREKPIVGWRVRKRGSLILKK